MLLRLFASRITNAANNVTKFLNLLLPLTCFRKKLPTKKLKSLFNNCTNRFFLKVLTFRNSNKKLALKYGTESSR
ncbi:hypothetical protein GGTG_12387 [Gaeumannomyces tritici R3-111a-1]|uniref:Uncharacterized protein n=1 Tax=Gaeumannomyces tritici (strain R3-111a-1) TaxID=644352 RepID=J3PFW2_GAET3|nr:hypothetical protein GGTG_12387 [Gaeumannomyces tritici R3-111a-1]EJT70214.1 hypothetical protein GGTG_12387 [Gaeumannomyces tritici R3-111a-1]